MNPAQIALAIKLGIYAVIALAVIGSLAYLRHSIFQDGVNQTTAKYEKRDQETAAKSAKLLADKEAEVKQANDEQTRRLVNATKVYADHASNLQSDVDNLTKRLQRSGPTANCRVNTLPGASDDNSGRKSEDYGVDREIAKTVIELANLCEKKIEELPVVN